MFSRSVVSPERATIRETEADFDRVAALLKEQQQAGDKKLLWGTACLFTHPRYAQGGATSPEVGGEGYTFWGGCEGYTTLLNADLKREREYLVRFLHLAVDYKK